MDNNQEYGSTLIELMRGKTSPIGFIFDNNSSSKAVEIAVAIPPVKVICVSTPSS